MNKKSFVDDCVNAIFNMVEVYSIKDLNVVELFCGDGTLFSGLMSKHCDSLVGYEIDPKKEHAFLQNVRNGVFICRDSVKMMQEAQEGELGTYHIITIDSPSCIYGNNYCESFEIVPNLYKILPNNEVSIIALDIIHVPYNIEINQEWINRRSQFYLTDGNVLDIEYAKDFYSQKLREQGVDVIEMKPVCREWRDGIDYFYMLIASVIKRTQ